MIEFTALSQNDLLWGIALSSLAGARLAFALVWERGPRDVLTKVRERVGIEHEDGYPVVSPDTFLGQVFSCPRCLSVWTSFGMLVLWILAASWPGWVWWLAIPVGGFATAQIAAMIGEGKR